MPEKGLLAYLTLKSLTSSNLTDAGTSLWTMEVTYGIGCQYSVWYNFSKRETYVDNADIRIWLLRSLLKERN
jgi:hypothetical protein